MTIDYLVTTFKKTKKEIDELIKEINIKGSVLIGNQMVDDESIIKTGNATIYNSIGKGVSINRNNLINESRAEFVTFWDDDMRMQKDGETLIESAIKKYCDYDAVRFNVISDNLERPNKQIHKNEELKFHDLTSFGAWGCFFKKSFLDSKMLRFNEKMGPGTDINHGEDTVFLKEFFNKGGKMVQIDICPIHSLQNNSTWQGENRDIDKELLAHGYMFQKLYGKKAHFLSMAYALKHKKDFPKKTKIIRGMRKGIEKASKETR